MKANYFAALPLLLMNPAAGVVLFSDNFDTSDQRLNDELPPLASRISGTLTGDLALTSHRAHQLIVGNQLQGVATAGFRFENTTFLGAADRYDWAAGATGGNILTAGGFNVTFEWIAPDGAPDPTQWVAWTVGTNNADSGASVVNEAANDYGILFRVNGDTQRFDNGSPLTSANGAFSTASNTHVVSIDFSLSSWADGSNVTATSFVDGTQVANDSFQLDGNGGAFFMEFATNNTGSLIDNVTVSTLETIPEASSMLLSGMAFLSFLACRRR